MNVLFGSAGRTDDCADLTSAVGELFGMEPKMDRFEGAAGVQTLGALSDNGSIIGHAVSGTVTLAFIGAFCLPLVNWKSDSSPLDDPGRTARFLLERYMASGRQFLEGVNGQFAIAIMDSASGSTLIATDPFGGRTWYVCECDEGILFSSHLLTLAKSRGPALRIDRSFEDFFLIYGFYPFGHTPYVGIRALEPGTLVEWQQGQTSTTTIAAVNPWATDKAFPDGEREESEVVNELYDAMVRATREQLPSRKQRVAVLLGGFDSALVAALIHRLGYEVETYSFRYYDAVYNQPHTDTLAAFLGIRHQWVDIDREIVEEGIRHFPETFNQPTNWPNYVLQTAHICDRIRQDGIQHVYSGDGCDAAFLGYPGTYLRARIFAGMPVLPRWLHAAILALTVHPNLDRWLGHPYRVAVNMLRGLGRPMPARGYLSFRVMDEVSLQQLRISESPVFDAPVEEIVKELSAKFASLPPLRLAYQGKAAVSPNRNKLIGSSDRAGVTIFSPYMHPGLKSFAVNLPEELMRPRKNTKSKITGKYILMKMAEEKQLLTPPIIYQKKVAAVDAPIDEWYDGPMRPMMLETIEGLPFEYNKRYVRRLLDEKRSEKVFKHLVMTDKVISHAVSLLATYATFTAIAKLGIDDP